MNAVTAAYGLSFNFSFKILLQQSPSEVAPAISRCELGFGEESLTLEHKSLL